MTPDTDRVIVVQFFKENQWFDCHHTFDDPNVIRRVFSMIQSQFHDTPIRFCDRSGHEIDMAPYLKAPLSRFKHRKIGAH